MAFRSYDLAAGLRTAARATAGTTTIIAASMLRPLITMGES